MRFLLIHIFIFLTLISFSQNVSVKAYIDSSRIRIGSQVTLSFEIEKNKSVSTLFPALTDTITKQVEVIRKFPVDTLSAKNDIVTLRQRYLITCFDSGSYSIPSFEFLIKRDATVDTLRTNPLHLSVVTIPVDTMKKDFRDIKVPYGASITLMEILTWVLFIILAGLIVLIVIYIIQKRRKKQPLLRFPEKPKDPAFIIALRELDRLKEEKLWQQDKIKLYHSELTDIIRRYIENRFSVMAVEMTSYEILYSIEKSGLIAGISLEKLRQMLLLADLVKFAKAQPLPDENDLSMRNAYSFVNETKDEPKLIEESKSIDESNSKSETKISEG